MKTNKSYTKRLKVTKNGKILARRPGQNHFNAKETASTTHVKSTYKIIKLKNKDRGRYLGSK